MGTALLLPDRLFLFSNARVEEALLPKAAALAGTKTQRRKGNA